MWVLASVAADVGGNLGERQRAVDGVGGGVGEGKISAGDVDKVAVEPGGDVVAELRFAAFPPDFAMDQVVHNFSSARAGPDANAARKIPFRTPDAVMPNIDGVRVPELDAAISATNDAVVSDCPGRNIGERFAGNVGGGLAGIAEGNATVAIDDEVALDDDVFGPDPNENGGAGATVSTFDIAKNIVAESPVLERHHVDARDVIAAEKPVLGWDFCIFEIAETHRTVDGLHLRVLVGGTFDGADADIAETAVVNVDIARGTFGFDLDAVGAGFGKSEIGDSDLFAVSNVKEIAAVGFPARAEQCDLGGIPRPAP